MENFEITVKEIDSVKVLSLKGYLDAHTALELEETLRNIIQGGGCQILVNMKNLSYISSAGFGVFMEFIEDVRNKNGDIKFSSVPKKITELFDILGFKYIFEIYRTDKDAIKAFSEKKSKRKHGKKGRKK